MEYGIGVALAMLVCTGAWLAGFDRERGFYPTLLMVIASYYLLFAVMAGTPWTLAGESFPALIFVLAAVTGFKKTPWIIVTALVAHGLFDFSHAALIENPGVPSWWPGFCLGFDAMAAAFLAALLVVRARVAATGT